MDFTHICSIQHEIVLWRLWITRQLWFTNSYSPPEPSRLRHVHFLAIAETQNESNQTNTPYESTFSSNLMSVDILLTKTGQMIEYRFKGKNIL